ncbi:MAG: mechanosensitive ion channel family protein [Bacillota bacterium]|jgi:small-conductance mechanosensitive channel
MEGTELTIPFIVKWLSEIEFSMIFTNVLKIAIVIAICIIAIKLGKKIINNIFLKATNIKNSKRVETLSSVCVSVWRYVVYFITILVVMSILNIDIMPVLASAGVAGVAIGFGAQSLVKDVISGFFILFENYYEVGDFIETSGVQGFVEGIGLRSTKMKDWDGSVHVFPNGQVDVVTNYSQGDLTASLRIPVSYVNDIEKALDIVKKVCQDVKQELMQLSHGPTVLGVDELGERQIFIRISFDAALKDKFEIERQLRRRCIEALDEGGITLPYAFKQISFEQERLVAKQ